MEGLDPLSTACCLAGPPAQAKLPSSCSMQVPFLQLDSSQGSGGDMHERMVTYLC